MSSLWKAFTAFSLPMWFFIDTYLLNFQQIHSHSFLCIPHFLERLFHKCKYSYCSTLSISFTTWSLKELGNDLMFMHWNCCDANQYCLAVSLYIFLPPPGSVLPFSWTVLQTGQWLMHFVTFEWHSPDPPFLGIGIK